MSAPNIRLPVTIITGFLGSGKTTLLNHILTESHGLRLAVIENEFGDVGVDDLLVKNKIGIEGEEIIEMMNGCICCTVRGDLIEVIKRIFGRENTKLDGIIIETTGLADPAPVAQTFFVDEFVMSKCKLDAIITVVDAKHIVQHLDEVKPAGVENESVEQIAFADRVLLNKIDLVSPEEKAIVHQRILGINKTVKIFDTVNCCIDPKLLLNISGFSLAEILKLEPDFLNTEDEHLHDSSVTSVGLHHKDPVNIGKLKNWINEIITTKATDLLRYKGVVYVHNKANRFIFHGVHMLFQGTFGPEWEDGETRETKFIFIGKNLNRDELVNGFLACSVLVTALRFPVGATVYAKHGEGKGKKAFKKGVVLCLWDEGNPYRIKLDDGTEVWAPEDVDDFVRATN